MALPASPAHGWASWARAMTGRRDRRRTPRLRQAPVRLRARLEASADRHPRGLAKALRLRLASCPGGYARHHGLRTGPTGLGKTGRACAWGPKAWRAGETGR
jgi:hypothetical protein